MKLLLLTFALFLSACTLMDFRNTTDDDIQIGKVWERSIDFYFDDEDEEECLEILRDMKLSKIEYLTVE